MLLWPLAALNKTQQRAPLCAQTSANEKFTALAGPSSKSLFFFAPSSLRQVSAANISFYTRPCKVAANGMNFKFMEKVIAPGKELSAPAYFLLRKLKA
jgi:hypothetical protein